uniref:Copia protein n=1 Tax=Fagus sylvatica TaxID=28930 RepID=A0A2N9EWG3_FAGSY
MPRTKHIDVRFHKIRELIVTGDIVLKKVHTSENAADMLTKPVTTANSTAGESPARPWESRLPHSSRPQSPSPSLIFFSVSPPDEGRSCRAPPLDLPPPWRGSRSSETSLNLVRSRQTLQDLAGSGEISPDLARSRRICEISPDLVKSPPPRRGSRSSETSPDLVRSCQI